jgi:SAM-dependent methyltransferase
MPEGTPSRRSEIDPNLAQFYATGAEAERLTKTPLELERNKAILAEQLPPAGRVLDIGGGTGIYASWLAERGFQVDLVEPIPLHVEQAREAARSGAHFEVHLGEARNLEFADRTADAVLLMGPLYCLLHPEERIAALREALRVLRPGGVLVAAALGRFTIFLRAIVGNWFLRPGALEDVMATIASGIAITGPVDIPVALYMHRPNDLRDEIVSAGFAEVEILASTGQYLGITDIRERLSDTASKAALLEALRIVEKDPGIVGVADSLMAIARRLPNDRGAKGRS